MDTLSPQYRRNRDNRAYAGRMRGNEIGYDPAEFGAGDPARDERDGAKIRHTGRHRGTDGQIIADQRLTSQLLRADRGPMSPIAAPSMREQATAAIGKANPIAISRSDVTPAAPQIISVGGWNNATGGDFGDYVRTPTGEKVNKVSAEKSASGAWQRKQSGAQDSPMMPRMAPTSINPDGSAGTMGPVPRAGKIDGTAASEAILAAKRSAAQSMAPRPAPAPSAKAIGRQAAQNSIAQRGLTGAIRENLSRPQPLDVPMPGYGLQQINKSANAVQAPKISTPQQKATPSRPTAPQQKAFMPMPMQALVQPQAPAFNPARPPTPLPTMGLGKGSMNTPMQKLAAAPMGSPAFTSAASNLASTAAKKIASVPGAIGSAIETKFNNRKRIY